MPLAVRTLLTGALLSAVTATAAGYAQQPIVQTPVPVDLAAAEAEGAASARGEPSSVQPAFGQADVREPQRKCLEVGAGRVALAGDFEAGPFDAFSSSWQRGRTKVWWAPRFLSITALGDQAPQGLVVRGRRLDDTHEASTYWYSYLVRGVPNGLIFFNSDFWLPSAGRWLLVATYGTNWGCFIVQTR